MFNAAEVLLKKNVFNEKCALNFNYKKVAGKIRKLFLKVREWIKKK